jgi:L-malate glycosyltransferase
MRKLLVVGSNGVNLYNIINLTKDYFDDILFITTKINKNFDYGNIKIFVADFSLKNPLKVIFNILKIRDQIKKFNPDIIHVHQINSCAFLTILASQKLNKPIVATAWGSDILLNSKSSFILKRILIYCLNNIDYFTSGSNYLAFEMQQLCKKKTLDITYANYGINVIFNNIPRENIIYSNRQHKKLYRVDLIIKAFHVFNENRKAESWKLVIAGDGEEKQNLENLVKELNLNEQVYFAGWLNKEQNSEYYNRSKYYVSIPVSDGSPVSVVEAMACGCIPILSNLPANNELVIDNYNGIIVNDLSGDFIQRALLLDHERAMEINRELAIKKGDKEVNRMKYYDLYDKIINLRF